MKKNQKKDKLYTSNSTGAIIKQIGKKFLLPVGFIGNKHHINAEIIDHVLEDDIGSVYEFALSEITRVKA